MPLVRISVYSVAASQDLKIISDCVYEAMRETIGIPEGDRFMVATRHPAEELFVDPHFMNIERTDSFILVQIFLSQGRTVEQKQALFRAVATRLHNALGVSTSDVMTVLTENTYVDWSFGNGDAQYVLNPPAWVRKTSEH
jgi:4-oxalocrotonate tautomerase